jgi:hypothetical protein
MIQRIQSLYLVCVLFAQLVVMLTAEGAYLKLEYLQSSQLRAGHFFMIALLAVTLFMFMKRPLQLRLIVVSVGFILLKLGWGLYAISLTDFNFSTDFGIGLDLLSMMLLLLAHRAIRKDEALVRSIDRIR